MIPVRRRSWASGRQPRKDGLRLSTMIVLLAVVVVLMFAASRPEIWVQLVPGLDSQAPATATKSNVEIAPATPTKAQPAPPQTDPTRLRLIGLIILAVMYFGWRFARMGRALRQRRPPTRVGPGMSSPTPASPDEV
jgi:hypothetical protein